MGGYQDERVRRLEKSGTMERRGLKEGRKTSEGSGSRKWLRAKGTNG